MTTFVVLRASWPSALAPEGDCPERAAQPGPPASPTRCARSLLTEPCADGAPPAFADCCHSVASSRAVRRWPLPTTVRSSSRRRSPCAAEAFGRRLLPARPDGDRGPRVGRRGPGARRAAPSDLCDRLARETAASWAARRGSSATMRPSLPPATDRLRVTTLPAVDEAYAPLTMSVPIQRLAASAGPGTRSRARGPAALAEGDRPRDDASRARRHRAGPPGGPNGGGTDDATTTASDAAGWWPRPWRRVVGRRLGARWPRTRSPST